MSENIENISAASDNGIKSVERLTTSIEKMNSSLSAINVSGLEELERTFSSIGESLKSQKKSLDEVLLAYIALEEEIKAVSDTNDETSETMQDGLSAGIDAMTELQNKVSSDFGSISKFMSGSDKAVMESISLVTRFSGAITQTCGGVVDLVNNWNTMSDMEKGVGIMQTAAAAAIALASAIALVKSVGKSGLVGLIVGGVAIAAAIATFALTTKQAADSIKSHEAGGGFNTADLFYANENGNVELIASSNNGGGAVMNMEQLRSAVYDGVYTAMTEGRSNSPGVVMIDGVKAGKLVASGVYNEGKRVGYWR